MDQMDTYCHDVISKIIIPVIIEGTKSYNPVQLDDINSLITPDYINQCVTRCIDCINKNDFMTNSDYGWIKGHKNMQDSDSSDDIRILSQYMLNGHIFNDVWSQACFGYVCGDNVCNLMYQHIWGKYEVF